MRIVDLRTRQVGPVSLTVAAGECICLWGSSGAGKSLLLRAVADLDPHDGEVFLGEAACGGLAPDDWRRRVGLLPAESRWWGDRVGEHFARAECGRLEQLGFTLEALDWSVSRLSTGERQRLAVARLLAQRPRALLLDEPTASLDPRNVTRTEEMIATYRQAEQAPVLWVSHDSQQVRRVSQRCFKIAAGRITEEAPW